MTALPLVYSYEFLCALPLLTWTAPLLHHADALRRKAPGEVPQHRSRSDCLESHASRGHDGVCPGCSTGGHRVVKEMAAERGDDPGCDMTVEPAPSCTRSHGLSVGADSLCLPSQAARGGRHLGDITPALCLVPAHELKATPTDTCERRSGGRAGVMLWAWPRDATSPCSYPSNQLVARVRHGAVRKAPNRAFVVGRGARGLGRRAPCQALGAAVAPKGRVAHGDTTFVGQLFPYELRRVAAAERGIHQFTHREKRGAVSAASCVAAVCGQLLQSVEEFFSSGHRDLIVSRVRLLRHHRPTAPLPEPDCRATQALSQRRAGVAAQTNPCSAFYIS
jgi:hypothetical protein